MGTKDFVPIRSRNNPAVYLPFFLAGFFLAAAFLVAHFIVTILPFHSIFDRDEITASSLNDSYITIWKIKCQEKNHFSASKRNFDGVLGCPDAAGAEPLLPEKCRPRRNRERATGRIIWNT